MKIQLIRSATLKLHYSGHTILIDPYLSPKFNLPSYTGKSRNPMTDLPLSHNEILSGVETILVSHLHSDHFDIVAQNTLSKTIPVVCQDNDELKMREMGFENLQPVKESGRIGNILIQRIAGRHGEGEVLERMGITSGFLFGAKDESDLFWAGDTILYEGLKDWLVKRKPKVIITHSAGAVWGNNVKIIMDDVQTVEICQLLPESIVIATHMETLDHCTVTRRQLRDYADEKGISQKQLFIPADGEEIQLN